MVLHLTVKEVFQIHCLNWRNSHFLQSFSTYHESWFEHTAELSSIIHSALYFPICCSHGSPSEISQAGSECCAVSLMEGVVKYGLFIGLDNKIIATK